MGWAKEPAVQAAKVLALGPLARIRGTPAQEGRVDAWAAGSAPTARAPARGAVRAERWRLVHAEGTPSGPPTRWRAKVQARLRAARDPGAESEEVVGFGRVRSLCTSVHSRCTI